MRNHTFGMTACRWLDLAQSVRAAETYGFRALECRIGGAAFSCRLRMEHSAPCRPAAPSVWP